MSIHAAEVHWLRVDANFLDNRYPRAHVWRFDGGVTVPASASPAVVPTPYSDPAAVDPEEAFVASLSSCHMLWFLSLAARRGFTVDSYRDQAFGEMENNAGHLWMARVTLRPEARFAGDNQPDASAVMSLHHDAHAACFLANSVRTAIACEPVFDDSRSEFHG